MIVEICVQSKSSALMAKQFGADRIELCSALELGGLTPSSGLIQSVISEIQLPVHVLIRPMIEKMGYKDKEEEEMSKEEVVENKEELSAETVEPIKHNPEAETKNVNFTIAGKRTETTKDRVYNKIFNN